jgi:hypothetical protein
VVSLLGAQQKKRKYGGEGQQQQAPGADDSAAPRPTRRAVAAPAPEPQTLAPAARSFRAAHMPPPAAPAAARDKQAAELRAGLIKQQKELLETAARLRKDVDPALRAELMARIRALQARIESLVKGERAAAAPAAPAAPRTPATPVQMPAQGAGASGSRVRADSAAVSIALAELRARREQRVREAQSGGAVASAEPATPAASTPDRHASPGPAAARTPSPGPLLDSAQQTPLAPLPPPAAPVDAYRQKLGELRAEAAAMGLDTSLPVRGRGRGFARGARGGAFGVGRGAAAVSPLDRPLVVRVADVPADLASRRAVEAHFRVRPPAARVGNGV